MLTPDTDLLFPPRVIPALATLRGPVWQKMVQSAVSAVDTSVERLAFIWTMVGLCGCATCDRDTIRGLNGCTRCACQAIRRFKGTDDDLLSIYRQSCGEVKAYLSKKKQ